MIGSFLSGNASEFRHLHLDEVSSTNTYLVEKARDGEAGNLWVTTDLQSAAKGSRGRHWESMSGNLFASLLLQNPAPRDHLADLSFVAALAVADVVLELGGSAMPVKVKWPNDVLISGKKCAGILLEGGDVGGELYVVVGIGINCKSYPKETLHASTSLLSEGLNVSAGQFFQHLASSFQSRLTQWKSGANFAAIRRDWLSLVYGIGETVKVVVPEQGEFSGRFASVDDKGYMLLELEDGTSKRISAADIFFED